MQFLAALWLFLSLLVSWGGLSFNAGAVEVIKVGVYDFLPFVFAQPKDQRSRGVAFSLLKK
jgi:hypothetical protein